MCVCVCVCVCVCERVSMCVCVYVCVIEGGADFPQQTVNIIVTGRRLCLSCVYWFGVLLSSFFNTCRHVYLFPAI